MKFSVRVGSGPTNKWSNFGGDTDRGSEYMCVCVCACVCVPVCVCVCVEVLVSRRCHLFCLAQTRRGWTLRNLVVSCRIRVTSACMTMDCRRLTWYLVVCQYSVTHSLSGFCCCVLSPTDGDCNYSYSFCALHHAAGNTKGVKLAIQRLHFGDNSLLTFPYQWWS